MNTRIIINHWLIVWHKNFNLNCTFLILSTIHGLGERRGGIMLGICVYAKETQIKLWSSGGTIIIVVVVVVVRTHQPERATTSYVGYSTLLTNCMCSYCIARNTFNILQATFPYSCATHGYTPHHWTLSSSSFTAIHPVRPSTFRSAALHINISRAPPKPCRPYFLSYTSFMVVTVLPTLLDSFRDREAHLQSPACSCFAGADLMIKTRSTGGGGLHAVKNVKIVSAHNMTLSWSVMHQTGTETELSRSQLVLLVCMFVIRCHVNQHQSAGAAAAVVAVMAVMVPQRHRQSKVCPEDVENTTILATPMLHKLARIRLQSLAHKQPRLLLLLLFVPPWLWLCVRVCVYWAQCRTCPAMKLIVSAAASGWMWFI